MVGIHSLLTHPCDGYYSHCFAEQKRFKLYTQDAISEMKSYKVSRLNYAYIYIYITRAKDDNSDTRKVLLFVCMEIWWRSVTDSETGIFVFCKMRIVTMFITIDGHLVYFSSTLPLTNISQEFITIWYFSSTLPLTNICFSLHVDLLQSQSPTISMHIHCLALRFKFCARILGCALAVA